MPVLSAAALGALVGAAMPAKGTRKSSLRGRIRARNSLAMAKLMRSQRFRRRGKRLSRRQWQAKARRQVGMPKNHATSKTTESVLPSAITTVASKTVSSKALINISGTGSNAIDARQRYMCNISGIKIDATFENNLTDTRIYVNWAVVHGKQGQTINASTPDFFRAYTDDRANDANSASTVTGLSYCNAQINSDEFVVLKRGKFMLTPGTNSGYNVGMSTKEKSVYVKLNRAFYFDPGANVPNDQIYFVCWAGAPEELLTTTASVLSYNLRAICYWREPKNY